MLKRSVLPFVVLVSAVIIFIVLKQTKADAPIVEKVEKVWKVNTVLVNFQTLSPEIVLYGRIESPSTSTLTSSLEADVLSVDALDGQMVTKGQLLISLDDIDIQLLLAQRQADVDESNALIYSENQRFNRDKKLLIQEQALLALTEKAVKRAITLEKKRLTSQVNLDDALASKQRQVLVVQRLHFDIADHSSRLTQLNARLKRNQALLAQSDVDVKRSQITAPFNGRISSVSVSAGERVKSGEQLLSLYNIDELELRAQIPNRHLADINTLLAKGESLVSVAKNVSFSLDRLSGEIQLNSGGIDGLFRVTSSQSSLTLGEFITLNLTLSAHEHVFSLPYNALYRLNYVYAVQEGYLQRVSIERVGEYTDSSGNKQLIITSRDLQQGDVVLSTQLPNAISGLRVESVSE